MSKISEGLGILARTVNASRGFSSEISTTGMAYQLHFEMRPNQPGTAKLTPTETVSVAPDGLDDQTEEFGSLRDTSPASQMASSLSPAGTPTGSS